MEMKESFLMCVKKTEAFGAGMVRGQFWGGQPEMCG